MQINQSPKNSENQDGSMTKGQIKALVTLGIANIIMLISYSSYLAYYLITPSFQNTSLGLGLWVFIMFSMPLVNYSLYKNYRKQTRLAGAV
jgi:hypothetical protein